MLYSKQCPCFSVEFKCKNNHMHAYSSVVKLITTSNPNQVELLDRNLCLYRAEKVSGIQSTYTDSYFNDLYRLEKSTIVWVKTEGFHLCDPLLLDLCGQELPAE